MAGPKKRRAIDGEDNSAQDNMDIETTLAADFEGMNPCESDFHGIQQLLKQSFLKAHINLGELCEMIIAQQGLGSVLKQSFDEADDDDDDDDDANDVFGITTVLNLTANKNKDSVSQLLSIVDELSVKHADVKIQENIKNILNDSNKIGLLINERFINIPAKIADPLMDTLNQELTRIAKKNSSYKFDYFLMICKTHKQFDKQKKEEGYIFINAEEEVFAKMSDVSFEFNVSNESDMGVGGLWTEEDKQMVPHRKILLIKAAKFNEIVQEVKIFVA